MQTPEERNIRINKVLRELNISLERAINYLTFVGVKIESNPNSKISLFEYKLLFDEFSKSKVILKDRYYSEEGNIRIYKVLAELNISLTEAINFWKVSGYEILSNPNTLITEREYSIIKNNFVPIPIEIFEIENFYNIKLKIQDEPNGYENQNNFQLNENNKLVALNLSNNAITDLGILKILPDMKILLLNDNLIQDLYHLSFLNNLTQLDLSNNIIDDLSGLSDLKNLKLLNLFNNNISNLFPLKYIVSLTTLDLHKNKIVDLKGLENLKNLMYLNLSGNLIFGDYSQLSNLNELKTLRITDNKILNFDFLPISLSDLSLKDCQIKDISFLSKNTDLESLDLSYNLISDISVLKKLRNLRRLNLTWNAIQDLSQFESIKFLYDIDLRVAENPFVMNKNLVLDKNGNHFFTVINAMLKEKELKSLYEIVDNFTLPAKVLLLGNTQSGKSTMMNYLLQEGNKRKINECKDSTHILSIVTKPKNVKINDLPQAIFFDFGGQDYYHGLYRAFLNNGALSILFWNVENDKNQIRKDDRNNIFTRDFDRNYWLHQLKYIENKNDWHPFSKDPSDKSNTVLMVQTYADKEGIKRNTYNGDCDHMNIENEFFVALNQDSIDKIPKHKISLDYFEEVLNEQILLKQETKTETKWYSDFLNYIQQQKGAPATNLTEIGKHYKRDSDKKKKYLPEVLKDLARTGLILYYNDDTDLKDIAWLDPTATIAYIHKNILKNEELIKNKGKIDRLKFEENDSKILKLLINQKVVFLDQNPLEDKYIVPGYLPLTTDDNLIYDLMTFDFIDPNFVLKFKNFIPFGLINQLICYYGNNTEKKHCWRDQLLFTKDDFKVFNKIRF
jgi:internalin A